MLHRAVALLVMGGLGESLRNPILRSSRLSVCLAIDTWNVSHKPLAEIDDTPADLAVHGGDGAALDRCGKGRSVRVVEPAWLTRSLYGRSVRPGLGR